MTSHRLRHLGAALAGAALLTASGLIASPGQEPGTAPRPEARAKDEPPSPDDQVEALVRRYDDARAVLWSRPPDPRADRKKVQEELKKSRGLLEDVSRQLLDLADRHPRTNAAEQALTWIACNNRSFTVKQSADAERALEILARDYIRSDRIKTVLGVTSPFSSWASPSFESLLRRALERSPYYEIRGLACIRLAELLIERANGVRIWKLLGSPPQPSDSRLRGGPEVVALLRRSDPDRLEAEAATLLERVLAQFPRVTENHGDHDRLGMGLEGPAKIELDRIRRLSVGKPAPEIVGVDLDGKPMKLSDYRGQVVVLYFSAYFSFFGDRSTALLADRFRKLQTTFAGKPFAIVGVITRQTEYRKAFRASGLPVRFWADEATRDQLAGPIHTAWDCVEANGADTYYVLDPGGTIRYADLPSHLIEKAVTTLLEEQRPAGRGG